MARAKGSGTVYFDDHRSKWVAQLRWTDEDTGRQRSRKRIADTAKEAQQLLDRLVSERDAQSPTERIRTGDLVARYVDSTVGTKAPATIEKWRKAALLLDPIGDVYVDRLTVNAIEDAFAIAATRVTRDYLARARQVLISAFRYGQRQGITDRNPAADTVLPGVTEGKPRPAKALTEDEAARLLAAAADQRLGIAITLGLRLGLRVGEIRALDWGHVDLDQQTLTIAQSMNGSGDIVKAKTKQSVRIIALPVDVAADLKHHRERQDAELEVVADRWPKSDLVVRTQRGTAIDPSNFRRLLRVVGRDAGVEGVAPKDLRTSFASIAVHQGVPITAIADVLGHNDATMLLRKYRKQIVPVATGALDVGTMTDG